MAEPHVPVKMNRHLCCRICHEVLRNPATIPCGHNFCMQCILNIWDQMNNRPCRCPECGREFPSRPQLIQNITLAELVRDTGGSDCQKRKQQCSGESQQEPKIPRISTEPSGSTLCMRHNRPLDIYCCTDEQIICLECTSAEHGGHKVEPVTEECGRRQEELRNMQTKFKETLEKQEQKWENMEKTFKQIQEKARKTDDDCESIIVGVIDSLQKHYCSVKETIGAQEKAAAAQLNASLQNLQEKMEEMKKRDAELDQLAQNENNADFLQKWSSLRLLCEKDVLHLLQEVPEDPLLPFELTKTAVEELGRQLEEFCDKEFGTISQIGLSGAEPETRADFLQYACELSLDSQTAHKSLIISEGDKKVMQISQEWRSPAHPYPQRFVKRRQVLCKEGLQADRCYYEVEVEGDVVEIALAYKGIDRKSHNKLSAFGGNTNSWSLDRSKTYSVSHKDNSVLLTTPPRHPRIGVYLKFKEGTLSFYEVSDSDGMTFLYKVDAEFTEPLYAGFWLGDKCSIRICDLTQNRP